MLDKGHRRVFDRHFGASEDQFGCPILAAKLPAREGSSLYRLPALCVPSRQAWPAQSTSCRSRSRARVSVLAAHLSSGAA